MAGEQKRSLIAKLVTLAVVPFVVAVVITIIMGTFVFLASMVSVTIFCAYLLASWKRKQKADGLQQQKKKEKELVWAHRKRVSVFAVYICVFVLPLAVAAVYSIEVGSYFGTSFSVYSAVVAFSLALTFMYTFLNVPLTIYHKKLEDSIPAPESFPLITIIVPAYNEERTIAKTLDSLAEADYPKKEIIVIDDGSADNTFAEATQYRHKFGKDVLHYSVIQKPENSGKSSAINHGLLFAKGEYVVTVDADSIVSRDGLKMIVKYFQNPSVAGVGGNVKVMNRTSLLTNCQALEYLVGINLWRRAFDIFGVVMVVPGALGAFNKKILRQAGNYDKDTLTEDFDITIKALKCGKVVQASSGAMAYTEAPATLGDLYKQRIRWYRGNMQTFVKHKDIATNSRYGMLRKYGYPVTVFTMLMLPILGVVIGIAGIIAILQGMWMFMLFSFLLFTSLQFVLSAIALLIDEKEDDWKVVLYSPLMVVGYKHLVDLIIIKGVLDVAFGRKRLGWTSGKIQERQGEEVAAATAASPTPPPFSSLQKDRAGATAAVDDGK
ncbi:MAG TPA: glycosyltransferase family 2 protein [Nitrososphaera sp.]|nr:glycosyltransferase family 2 protein [Nitrososphaera sp.]